VREEGQVLDKTENSFLDNTEIPKSIEMGHVEKYQEKYFLLLSEMGGFTKENDTRTHT
jgi:hypothetical protein